MKSSCAVTSGREHHVAVTGDDSHDGSPSKPYRTISAAAQVAQPGDVITVHAGTYRERVTPPRGGESEARRITYRAAGGEDVVIKGSEVVRDWKPFMAGVWKTTLPNSFFGKCNPYKQLIAGDWFADMGRPHHTGEVYLNGKALFETHLLERLLDPQPLPDIQDREGSTFTWYGECDKTTTYLYANFHDRNPNEELVEINVRDACFYPDQPGRDYITVRGFRMCHAATQWAAPTAEQIGLIGTHWSKGWVIEHNVISDSKCAGVTLGKDRATGHNVWLKDPAKDGSIHYNEVVERALAAGWSSEKIGSHVVRNNTIFNCEQAGICGSLGAIFSRITGNHIYDIWARRQFNGAEMAGIKIHAAIDTLIGHNRVHHAGSGIWLDWMAQGARVSGNLCHDNSSQDLYIEVNHGPFLVDNNILLSGLNVRDVSEGGAYVHNLMAGKIDSQPEPQRATPYHRPHATAVAGICPTLGGDDRFHNNVFIGDGVIPAAGEANPASSQGHGLSVYDPRELPLQTGGNVYCHGARPYAGEKNALVLPGVNPAPELMEEREGVFLAIDTGDELTQAATMRVSTAMLGKAKIPDLPFVNADGSPLVIDTDYFGEKRDGATPSSGPFEHPGAGLMKLKVW